MTLRDDDDERFARSWTTAQPMVASYILSLVADAHQAEDILQNTAVACLRKIAAYDRSRPFAAWALGIARLEVLSSKRGVARGFLSFQADLVDAIGEACDELSAEMEASTAALHRCLAGMRGRGWEALRLRYECDLDHGAIGARLGMAAGAVRVLLSRVRSELRACIERRMQDAGRRP